MSVIATLVERPGTTRIFFDLRPTRPPQEDQRRIEEAITRAGMLAQEGVDSELARAA